MSMCSRASPKRGVITRNLRTPQQRGAFARSESQQPITFKWQEGAVTTEQRQRKGNSDKCEVPLEKADVFCALFVPITTGMKKGREEQGGTIHIGPANSGRIALEREKSFCGVQIRRRGGEQGDTKNKQKSEAFGGKELKNGTSRVRKPHEGVRPRNFQIPKERGAFARSES
ncbi:hypothetical protein BDK51DRAFT_34216 [Blyttiomyces helicus]|uniref:Uncharacterized protein n=1 Tax=Blyttiomyces helicus TaxID=388810 RepID=A0A4P9WAG3_9FUNG|nr:hypothetical protein BDK51DRAFT_34216 [Blyttiomyces helicus]|eukprot:RKO89202.1 hypothetical protein BDK51DRAFT_34216 [Blyttiomyces helicus]